MDQALVQGTDIAREYLEQKVAQEMELYYELLSDDEQAEVCETVDG